MKPDLRIIDSQAQAEDIIETLDDVTQKAVDGELSAVTVVMVYRDGTTNSCHSDLPSVTLMVGAIERAKHRLIEEAS